MPGLLPGPNPTPGGGGGVLGVDTGVLSPAQVAAVADLAGFRGQALTTAVAISFAEDGSHDPRAQNHNTNGTTDTGLWQINSVHAQYPAPTMMIPRANAQAAYVISAGGHNWTPWTTYQTGEYRAQIGAANAAITQMNQQGGAQKVAATIGHGEAGQQFGVVTAATSAWDAAMSIPHFLGELANVGTWERVGFVIAGLLAMGFGAFAILKSLGVPTPIPVPV